MMVMVPEVRVPSRTGLPEYWSFPDPEVANWTVPAWVAVYLQVKVADPPPGIVADDGVGPVARVTLPVPEGVGLPGATAFAEAVPVL